MNKKKTAVKPDVLRDIEGLGRTSEKKLNKKGILTYAQLAQTTPAELALILKDVRGMSEDHIKKEDWVNQAKALAHKDNNPNQSTANGQSYARFEIELLLEADNVVRRTKIKQRPSKEGDEYEGWDEQRLIDFMIKEADLRVSTHSLSWESSNQDPKKEEEYLRKIVRKLDVIDKEAGNSHVSISQEKPFDVHLDVDLSDLESPDNVPLFYNAKVIAKNLSNGSRQSIGSAQGKLVEKRLKLNVPSHQIAPGMYRLQVELGLNLVSNQLELTKVLPGGLLQVQ